MARSLGIHMKVQVKVLPTKSVIERRWGWSKLMCVCTEDQMRVQLLPHLHTVPQTSYFEVFFSSSKDNKSTQY